MSKILIQQKRGAEAIRYLYAGVKNDPENLNLFTCLGDALKQCLEYDLALKMYQKALHLAQKQENIEFAQEILLKIENIYNISPKDVPKGPQIGFFIRSLMKMLGGLGKQDWF